jgi:hydrophobe/amphiphile efflux-1 (HAE1) family protein
VAAGLIGGPPLRQGTSQFQYTVNVQGRLTDPAQFANMVVNVGLDGRITQFKDIGRAELAAADYSTAMTYDAKPAVAIAIFELPGANAIQTANTVYARLKELRPRFPQGVEYTIPYDTTLFVRDSMRDVIKTLFEGVGLVALVVLIFLQNWRAALVPLLAIPVSLIGTFAIMYVAHFSMNLLSLFGLVLAIGIVVDDAIVVVENVERWVAHGLTPREAAYRAMDEVTPAVIAIAFGLSAVFIPVAFISGITGQFYRQFALTISFSTLLSAFNSLTLSPALAALLLKPHDARPDWFTRGMNRCLGWFFRVFNNAFANTQAGYLCALKRVVRFSSITLLVYGGLVLLAYLGFHAVPTGFIPPQDQGYLIVPVQLPDAASIDRTQAVMSRVADIGLKTQGVKGVFTVAGLSILANANSSAAGVMFCPLDDFSKRAGNEFLSAGAIANRLRAQFAKIQDAIILVFPPPPVRGVGNAGGFKVQIEDRSGTATPEQLQAVTDQVIAAANKRPEIAKPVFSTFRASFPQLYGNVDRVKAKQQNVAVTDVFLALQVYLGGLYINDFNYLGRTWRVVAQADAPFRATAKEVSRFETRNSAGQMVPLGAVMDLKDTTGPDRVQRYDLYNSAEISGNAAPGFSSGQALDAMRDVATQVLPRQYSFEWTELAYQEELAGNSALFIFPLCILFVWLTHSAEYESFALSTAIILIVPMCLLCGIGGVWLRHMDNNIFTQIGFVVLAGMSVKNAVLIVEFAKQQQEHHRGMNAADAAIEAAHLRLRPILMTSLTFIFGVLPLIVATGAGSEMRQALGTAVFFGMIGVTVFGVFFTPVFYKVIRRLTGKYVLPEHELAEADRPPPASGEGI